MELKPITRQEKIIAGKDLTPITRMEKFLKQFGGGGGGLPTGGAPYQYLVTDGSGNTKWEDRLAYYDSRLVINVGETIQLVKVADKVPSWASIEAPIKRWLSDGTNTTVTPEEYVDLGNGSFVAGEITFFIATDNVEFNGIVFPEKGVYFLYSSGNTYVTGAASADSDMPEITWDGNVGMLKAIDPKFIPSELNEIVLPSSTPSSTKKFKITVNDSGTISTEEVLE